MKQANRDWEFLRAHTLVPGLCFLIALAIFGASYWYNDRQEKTFDLYSTNHSVIHEDYDALIYRRRLLDRYHRRYQELQERGFVGHENRLDWIETIRATAKALDLPNVTYSLEPQRTVLQPVDSVSGTAEVQVFLSKLDFELALVHELDLLRFFRKLEEEAPGLMKVDACNLVRQLGPSETLVAETNIIASCSMSMFSVITSDISFAAAGTQL